MLNNSLAVPGPVIGPVSPWWRHGMVWLVISGPLAVVLACAATAVLIALHPEPVIHAQAAAEDAPQAAVQVRNHLAAPR